RRMAARPTPASRLGSTSRRSSTRGSSRRAPRFAGRSDMATPPGVSERDFKAALDEFREAVGPEWVFTSDEDVALYRDAYSPYWGEPEERVASAAVEIGRAHV